MNNDKILSVFVDESGNFGTLNDPARYCIVTLVFHNQTDDIAGIIKELDRSNYDLGLDQEVFRFHTAPLIRQEDEYSAMSRRLRARIFDRMMTFLRKVNFYYHCFVVDTRYVNDAQQVADKIGRDMAVFMRARKLDLESVGAVKIYYDAGQKPVSRILETVFSDNFPCAASFAEGVRQSQYKMLQVADLICTMRLIELRLEEGLPLTLAERRFFGGPRDFKRNVLKKIKLKEI